MLTSYATKEIVVGAQAMRQIYGSVSKSITMGPTLLGQKEEVRLNSYISKHINIHKMLGREKNNLNLVQANATPESA